MSEVPNSGTKSQRGSDQMQTSETPLGLFGEAPSPPGQLKRLSAEEIEEEERKKEEGTEGVVVKVIQFNRSGKLLSFIREDHYYDFTQRDGGEGKMEGMARGGLAIESEQDADNARVLKMQQRHAAAFSAYRQHSRDQL